MKIRGAEFKITKQSILVQKEDEAVLDQEKFKLIESNKGIMAYEFFDSYEKLYYKGIVTIFAFAVGLRFSYAPTRIARKV